MVQRLRRSDFYSSFTDAIFLDIATLFADQLNTNAAQKFLSYDMAMRIRQR
ncbi:MAG: hypothetical protein ACJAS1_004168 [Oleiphilaceae bacterium]|jgi:hypothetical protein